MTNKNYYIRIDGKNKPVLNSMVYRSEKPAGAGWIKVSKAALGDCCAFGGDELFIPTSFVATAGGTPTTQIQLDWSAVAKATGYVVERSTASNFTTGLTTVYSGPLLTYLNTGLTTATLYYYRIRATNATSNSNYRFTSRTTA